MKLMFSCEIVHYWKDLISVFQKLFSSTDKILRGGLGNRLSFYEVLRCS